MSQLREEPPALQKQNKNYKDIESHRSHPRFFSLLSKVRWRCMNLHSQINQVQLEKLHCARHGKRWPQSLYSCLWWSGWELQAHNTKFLPCDVPEGQVRINRQDNQRTQQHRIKGWAVQFNCKGGHLGQPEIALDHSGKMLFSRHVSSSRARETGIKAWLIWTYKDVYANQFNVTKVCIEAYGMPGLTQGRWWW